MNKADFYRRRHRELMDREQHEESLPVAFLELILVIAGAMSWVAFLYVVA